MTNSVLENPINQNITASLPRRYGRHHLWWLVLLPIIMLLSAGIRQSYQETMDALLPEAVPVASTFNKRASGYSGLFELAQKMGISAQRWQRSYRNLPNLHGTLLIVAPWDAPSLPDCQRIVRWIDEGNDLILIDDFATTSVKTLLAGLALDFDAAGKRNEEVVAIASGVPEGKLADNIKATCEGHLAGQAKTVAADGEGGVFMQLTLGKGRCLVGTMPALCSNQYINDRQAKGNFQFLINWLSASRQPIFFDEKCHGFTVEENAFAYLLKNKIGYIVLQVIVIALVALVSLNQRFGQALSEAGARKISNVEFIDGLANALSRARARDAALFMLWQPFKANLCKALSVAPDEDVARIAAAWAERTGQAPACLRQFMDDAQAALDKRRLSQAELQQLVARLDDIKAKSAAIAAFGAPGSI